MAVVGAGFEPGSGARPSVALHSPLVLSCSRAAWTLGVRLGMTASAARFLSPDVRVVPADGGAERETVRAIADALLGASAVVDVGGRVGASGAHLAMYCEVPARTRGATFGGRLLELLDRLGIAGRIGIADDRFTAWVAAAHAADDGGREDRGVISVPRGGSAAFLAPRPLSLLAITPEVQHMLEALGVRTLGEFAALPAPSVSRPLEADYQALARGDSGSMLRPYAPDAPVREELVVSTAGSLFGGAAAVTTLAERLALRLAGRGREASRLELTVFGDRGERVVSLVADEPAATQDELVALLSRQIGEAPGSALRLRVVVAGEAIAGDAAADGGLGAAGLAATTAASLDGGARAAGAAVSAAGRQGADAGADADAIDALHAALSGAAVRVPRSSRGERAADGGDRSTPWQLSAPTTLRAERRDAHRRTRRARRVREVVAQSQLFGQADAEVRREEAGPEHAELANRW